MRRSSACIVAGCGLIVACTVWQAWSLGFEAFTLPPFRAGFRGKATGCNLALRAHSLGAGESAESPDLLANVGHWLRAVSACLVAALAVGLLAIQPAQARDGTISPPVCVAILDAQRNCPPREAAGALKNAETQLRGAEAQLKAAEKAAGRSLSLGESDGGEPEFVRYWADEVKRLQKNQAYITSVKQHLGENAAPSSGSERAPLRVVARLEIETNNVELEKRFWCEAMGMQTYVERPDGTALVAFGPTSYTRGDEGGFFAIAIRPLTGVSSSSSSSTAVASPLRLSHLQIATPAFLRLSKVTGNGGEILDAYGFNEVKSPAGVIVRQYIDDRRDPVEYIALTAKGGQEFDSAKAQLEKVGFKGVGPYVKVSPEMQAYVPELIDGNIFFNGGGNRADSPQLVLQPEASSAAAQPKLPELRMPAVFQNENETFFLDIPEKTEISVPVSTVSRARLFILAPPPVAEQAKQENSAQRQLAQGQLGIEVCTISALDG